MTTPNGTYVAPAAATVAPGLHKITYTLTNPVLKAGAALVVKLEGTWDSVVIPRVESAAAAKGVKLSLPRGNWMNKKTLVAGKVALPGLTYLPRKSYDPKTGVFVVWVVVR